MFGIAAVQNLTCLRTWARQSSQVKGPGQERCRSWHSLGRSRVTHPAFCAHFRARQHCAAFLAKAEVSDQGPASCGPSVPERLIAASLYVWPVCEGAWRLAIVFARIVQYHTLDWMVWINMHVKDIQDQAALRTVAQGCAALYQESGRLLKELLQLGSDSASIIVKDGKLQRCSATPGQLDSILSLVYIAIVSSAASAAHSRQKTEERQSRGSKPDDAESKTHANSPHVRRPELVVAASSCALLLRVSLVGMQGASTLATDTYKFVAVSLTLASVCTALAQVMQICFGNFEEDEHMVLQLVQQAGNIAWLHCALSLSDWALMLSMPYSWAVKIQVGITAAVTYALVSILRNNSWDLRWGFE